MSDQPNVGSQPDPDANLPARFSDGFLGWSVIVLLSIFGYGVNIVYGAFDNTSAEGTPTASRDAAAYVLFVIGLLALLLGVFFALVEARKPAVKVTTTTRGAGGEELTKLEGFAPAAASSESITKIVESFSGRRVSAVLLAIGFSLITLAAAGSGLVSVSVGDDAGTPTPVSTATASPTP